VQGPLQRLRLLLNGVSAHGPQALGEELGIGAVQGCDERLEAPLLHDGRAGLPDLQDCEHGPGLRFDLPHEAVKIPGRVMGCLLEDGVQFHAAEGQAMTLKRKRSQGVKFISR
jgi:hypothetical protein